MVPSPHTGQPCWIYKSKRQPEIYLYLAEPNGFEALPAALRQRFGAPELVMELVLHPERQLARAEIGEVLAALRTQGFYLQLPPKLEPRLVPGG
jgi:uncharacterized protein YcgL (UPF0745 family)